MYFYTRKECRDDVGRARRKAVGTADECQGVVSLSSREWNLVSHE